MMQDIDLLETRYGTGMGRLRAVREEQCLTQAQLGEKMGVAPCRVGYLENQPHISIMRIFILAQYVEALGGRLKVTAEFPDDGPPATV